MTTSITITTKQGKTLRFNTDMPGSSFVAAVSDAMGGNRKMRSKPLTIGSGNDMACVCISSIASVEAFEVDSKEET